MEGSVQSFDIIMLAIVLSLAISGWGFILRTELRAIRDELKKGRQE